MTKKQGKLYNQLEAKFIKEFLGSGERWYNYFWNEPGEKEGDEQNVKLEFEDIAQEVLDEAKADAPEWLKAMLSNVHSVEEAKAFIAFTTPKDNTELFIWFMKWFGEP